MYRPYSKIKQTLSPKKKNTLVLANGVVRNINASIERFPESLRKYHSFNQMTKEADATHAARIFFDSLEVSELAAV